MDEKDSGCPRCSDYDKLKEELDHNKKNADREVKDSLKKCETDKKKIQKQLLTMGAVAIVAGTILGKDFVDKVTEWIESFNSAKNAATNLIGSADTSPPTPPPPADDADEKKPEKKPTPKKTPRRYAGVPTGMPSLPLGGFSSPVSPYEEIFRDDTLDMMSMFTPEQNEFDSLALDLQMFSAVPFELDMSFDFPYTTIQDEPVYYTVPGPGVLATLGIGLFMTRKRRR